MGDVERRRERIHRLLKTRGPLGASEIEQLTGLTKGKVWVALKHGEEFGQHPGPGPLSAKWYAKEKKMVAAKQPENNDQSALLRAMAVIIAEHEVMRERLVETQEIYKGLPIRWVGSGEPIVNIEKVVGEYKSPPRVTKQQLRAIVVALHILLGHTPDIIDDDAGSIAEECKDFIRGIAERNPDANVTPEQITVVVKALQNLVIE